MFRHAERNVLTSVYGDDFTTVGSAADLDWFRKTLEERYALKVAECAGPSKLDEKESRVFNRVIRST